MLISFCYRVHQLSRWPKSQSICNAWVATLLTRKSCALILEPIIGIKARVMSSIPSGTIV